MGTDAWMNMKRKLPMFQEKILYPEFNSKLTHYLREAAIFNDYMVDVYKSIPYFRD